MGKRLILFCTGAAGYCCIELLARGYTHWSMGLTGGACLVGMAEITRRFGRASLVFCAVLSSLLITALELGVGLVVNLWLGWQVWSYAGEAYNILGQICPLYSLCWFLLALPCCALLSRLQLRRQAAQG